MVQAILDGRKSQTRRIVKIPDLIKEPDRFHYVGNSNNLDIPRKAISYDERVYHAWRLNNNNMPMWVDCCPYGKVGDVLWVREAWNITDPDDCIPGEYIGPRTCYTGTENGRDILWRYVYKATSPECHPDPKKGKCRWKPSIHMPKEACRIRLEITDIRVERLEDISYSDAVSEGIKYSNSPIDFCGYDYLSGGYNVMTTPRHPYLSLWRSINKIERFGTTGNPWVWVIEFKPV